MMKNKVLIYTEAWGSGGIESFVVGVVEELVSYEFTIYSVHDMDSVFDSRLVNSGVKRIALFHNVRPNLMRRLAAGVNFFKKFCLSNEFDIVHINAMNATGMIYAFAARKAGVRKVIVHSHNSDVGNHNKAIKLIIHYLIRTCLNSNEIERVACSSLAGKFMFGNKDFLVIPNGVDVQKFRFDQKRRENIRKKFGLTEDELLFGNLSRLSSAKNPLIQLEIFRNILVRRPDARYLMLNSGEMSNEVKKRIDELRLSDQVIQIDPTNHIEAFYCAMDALIMPSSFEGLPFVVIEAQASGLPVLCSECITQEVRIRGCEIRFISLDKGPSAWAESAINIALKPIQDRVRQAYLVEKSRFNRSKALFLLEQIYKKD